MTDRPPHSVEDSGEAPPDAGGARTPYRFRDDFIHVGRALPNVLANVALAMVALGFIALVLLGILMGMLGIGR